MDETAEVALDLISLVMHAAFGFAAGAILSIVLGAIVRIMSRRRRYLKPFTIRMKIPVRILLILLGVGLGVLIAVGWPNPPAEIAWLDMFIQGFVILLFLSGAYVVTGLINAVQDSVVERRSTVEDTPHARRLKTQAQVISRVGVAIVWIVAISGALLTFEQFRAVGASLLASAGLLSIVAGLAAQSSLANMFAGIQVAFTDAVRMGDLVIVDEHFGTVEEITLTYVVVASWDGRRWLVPSTVFISQTFENWTRHEPQLLGTVEVDLDWLVPVEAMRIQLQRIVKSSDLWDGRRVGLQVTEATGDNVRVRAVVSAATSGDLWDLRCFVREELVGWVQREAPYALPRVRLEPEPTSAPPLDEREELIEEAKADWEAEQAHDMTQQFDMPVDDDTDQTMLDNRRSWFQAVRDRRAAAREVRWSNRSGRADMGDLIAGILRQSDDLDRRRDDSNPDTVEMPKVEITDGEGTSISATARLYSGSPEGDELNRKYAGPHPDDLAERKRIADERDERLRAETDADPTGEADGDGGSDGGDGGR
ncbi:MAG: mechanosensitive ion channel [Propionibacterium sp.]|nr:mechanosensitive ion channel [Propionibacterium sp.]